MQILYFWAFDLLINVFSRPDRNEIGSAQLGG